MAAFSFFVLAYGIGRPPAHYFDEHMYVTGGLQMWSEGVNENWSHPPLGKWLIGTSMAAFGDNPYGWRMGGVIFGVIGLLALFALGTEMFASPWAGVAAAGFGLFNQLHYVQSRIATLDVYMFGFAAIGIWLWYRAWRRSEEQGRPPWKLFLLSALAFGCATACKWSGAVPLAVCFLFLLVRRSQWRVAGFLSIMAVAIYAVMQLLLIGMRNPKYAPRVAGADHKYNSVSEFVRLQEDMLVTHLDFTLRRPNRNESRWWSWPLTLVPIWYYHLPIPRVGRVAGILCVGNPIVFLFGFIAILVCAWDTLKSRSHLSAFIVCQYLAAWLIWAVMPRHVEYFYYYYPAAMILGLAIVRASMVFKLRRWSVTTLLVLSMACFFFYRPILSAVPLGRRAMHRRLLLPTWKWRY